MTFWLFTTCRCKTSVDRVKLASCPVVLWTQSVAGWAHFPRKTVS